MPRVEYVCPACKATVSGPPTLEGNDAPCPKCRAAVGPWPAPLVAAVEPPEKPAWHYSAGGARRGPVTASQLRALAEAGMLRPNDLVWREGAPEWVEAHTVPGLFPRWKPPPEKATWYYRVGGKQRGPVTESQLRSMAEDGSLRPEDHVWQEGMPDWVEASSLSWLFSDAKPAGPPPFRSDDEEEEDYRPRRRRRKKSDAWGAGEMTLFIILTVFIPLVGIIVGAIDLGSGGSRRRSQGGILLGLGIVMVFVHLAIYETRYEVHYYERR